MRRAFVVCVLLALVGLSAAGKKGTKGTRKRGGGYLLCL